MIFKAFVLAHGDRGDCLFCHFANTTEQVLQLTTLQLLQSFCSLLVELTAESSPSGEVHHQTAVDVYESAIHSLLDRDSSIAVWKEYLSYLGSVSLSSSENMNLYLNCTRRCLQAVEFSRINSHTDLGQLDHYEDYRFHNEVTRYACVCLSVVCCFFLLLR